MELSAVALAVLTWTSLAVHALGMSPVFGILAQPPPHGNTTFIVSSYVKWLEGAGARVVPIRPDAPSCELDFLMSRLNGMLFPGGSNPTDPTQGFGKAAYTVFKMAVTRKIPIYGTCQGHEQILRFVAFEGSEASPLGHFPSEGYALPLGFTADAVSTTFYKALSQDMIQDLTSFNLTINLHNYGVGLAKWSQSKALTDSFHVIATSVDTESKNFVALTQHKSLPIVTAQFHIEKNAYEFQQGHYDGTDDTGAAAVHGMQGVRIAQHFAAWLVDEARKTPFMWSPSSLDDWIIWNWQQTFSHKELGTAWEQQYSFPPHDGSSAACIGRESGIWL